MQTRQLGTSDLHITPIGVGAWAIGGGDWAFGWGPQDDAESIAAAALSRLAHDGKFDPAAAQQAILDLGIDPEKKDAQRA